MNNLGIRNKLMRLSAMATVAMMNFVPAYATGAGVFDGATSQIKNIVNQLITALKTVAVPIATAALLFCIIMMLISQNQKKVESYRSWAITIFIGIIAIFAVDFIISLAETVGSGFTA